MTYRDPEPVLRCAGCRVPLLARDVHIDPANGILCRRCSAHVRVLRLDRVAPASRVAAYAMAVGVSLMLALDALAYWLRD